MAQPAPDLHAPPPAFRFAVGFGGAPFETDCVFMEVSGIGPELDTEVVVEGGENRFVHALPKTVEHLRLVLKRGIVPLSSQLVAWCREVLEGGLGQPVTARSVHVFLVDEAGQALRRWSFENAVPVKWQVDAFSSAKDALVIETLELAYRAVRREA